MKETIGVLLAGGESRRFGHHKAFASYQGKFFWEHSFSVLKAVSDKQIIISHPNIAGKLKDAVLCPVLLDEPDVKGKGPMAGMITAMNHVQAEWYVFLACDIPLITNQAVLRLLHFRQHDIKAIIPKINGRLQPLTGVYHHSIYSLMKEQLENHEYRIISLLEKIEVLYVTEKDLQVDPSIFRNVNSQEDYTELHTNGKISESNNNS
ncbi:molybdenum cofactor guanylyltransferase [Metabacillus sp. Hm71]|uniref:molybdenum cofactor guanylyltransferase n=1 Tax=Metabacillus sp. Hm71 TaxID=3450743 RepID=UPI003F4424DF